MKRYRVEIDGMGCAHCVKRVTEALAALGAEVERVELGLAAFGFDGEIAAVTAAIEDCGFGVTSVSEA